MINESVHKAYLDMPLGDLMTNYPDIFYKLLFKQLNRSKINVNYSLAKRSYNNVKSEVLKGSGADYFTYHDRELLLGNDLSITFRLKGFNLMLQIQLNRTANFQLKSSMKSEELLEYIVKKINLMLEFQDDRSDWIKNVYNDSENMGHKKDKTLEGFEKYCESLNEKYKQYKFNVSGIKKDSAFTLKVYVNPYINVSFVKNRELINLREFNAPFQIDECLKIAKIADFYMNRYFNEEYYYLEWRDDYLTVYWGNPIYKKSFNIEDMRKRSEEETETKKKVLAMRLDRIGISVNSLSDLNRIMIIEALNDNEMSIG